jgi:hypothetical protein
MRRLNKSPVPGILFLLLIAALVLPAVGWAGSGNAKKAKEDRMSAMGRLATRIRATMAAGGSIGSMNKSGGDNCIAEPDCADDQDGPAGGQAEVAIAVDKTGQHIVIGFNDTRGFALTPLSVSGVMYSDDGGATFVDGGQLPAAGAGVVGVLGDPDVRYLGACNFVYSSIFIKQFSATKTVQTMSVHRSNDCGHTWQGPFEITPATNPNGLTSSSGSPLDTADKEFIDVDPETGRVIVSWSNFFPLSAGGVEISSTYSDNVLTATPPTWSPRKVVAAGPADGQASQPRFVGNGSPNAYIVWRQFPVLNGQNVGFARSTDNGATWSAPVSLTSDFFTMDYVLGNDRINTSPSIAVDNSPAQHGEHDRTRSDDHHSGHAGNIYVVYANNNNHDGSDVMFQKSTDTGLTFSAPVAINSRPGNDRAQWFPWVTVDTKTGRVWVFYYDQGIATSGDRSEVTATWSDDAGAHWSSPEPLTDRPFHAGWGNDTGQPNLGDYNQAVAQGGELFSAFAVAFRPPLGFVDGQPTSASLTVPDVAFRRVPQNSDGGDERDDNRSSGVSRSTNSIPVHLVSATTTDSGANGAIDPGETVRVTFTIRNYDTNPLSARRLNEAEGRLSTTTPGVTVIQDESSFPGMIPGASATSRRDFVLKISSSFVPGTPIELVLTVRSEDHGSAKLLHTLFTGTPAPTTLLSENFNSAAPGTLPAGWSSVHAGGAGTVPWTTSSTFCGGSNGAFHPNDNTGTRFERLFSPVINVPANADYVTLDFDVCYDTEDDPAFNVLAYDGFLVRVTDLTPGHFLRSVLAEAFEDQFTTGSFEHYPKHFPRNSNPNYFQDMSAWAGDSQGVKHVHLRLPGMAGTTVQLRFEYAQDSAGTCADVRPGHTCGVLLDNVNMKSVASISQ